MATVHDVVDGGGGIRGGVADVWARYVIVLFRDGPNLMRQLFCELYVNLGWQRTKPN